MARVNSLPSHGATNFCNTARQNEADLPLLLIFNMDGELQDPSRGQWVVYTDNVGDMMLVGDDLYKYSTGHC